MPQQYFLNKKQLNILKTQSKVKPSVSSSLGYLISYTKSSVRFNFFNGVAHGFSNSSHSPPFFFLRTFSSVFLRALNKSCSSIWPVIVRTRFSVLIIQLYIRKLTPINISSQKYICGLPSKNPWYLPPKKFIVDNITVLLSKQDKVGRQLVLKWV